MAFIPVNANDRVIVVTATSDGQTVFSFDFLAFTADQVKAIKVNLSDGARTDLVLDTDYTVSGLNQEAGGSITLTGVTIVTGDQIVIYSETEISRTAGYQQSGDFRADTVNREEDIQIMIAQEQQRDLNRSVKSEQGQPAFTVTTGAENQVPKFDANGNLIPGPTTTQIEGAEQSAIDAAASATEAEGHANAAAASNPALLLEKSENLNDLPDKPLARTNMGLGSMATEAASAYVRQDEKADDAQNDAGTDDTVWTTPAGVKRQLDLRTPKLLTRVTVTDQAFARVTGFDFVNFDRFECKWDSALPLSNGAEMRLRTSGDEFATAEVDAAASYGYSLVKPRQTAGLAQESDDSATFIYLSTNASNVASEGGVSGKLDIIGAGGARFTHFEVSTRYWTNNSDWRSLNGGAVRREAAVLNGLHFYYSTGNITGTFELWGHPIQPDP